MVPNVLSADVLQVLNGAVDANYQKIGLRQDRLDGRSHPTSGGQPAADFTGTHGRGDFGGFLWDWGEPAGAAFRSLIANEHAMRLFIGVIGDAFRYFNRILSPCHFKLRFALIDRRRIFIAHFSALRLQNQFRFWQQNGENGWHGRLAGLSGITQTAGAEGFVLQ